MKKNFVSYLLPTVLVMASLTVSAQQRQNPKAAASKPAPTAAAAKEAQEKSALDRTLEIVLSQIPFAKVDFNIDFQGYSRKNDTTKETNSGLNINFLELNAIVKFAKTNIVHKFVEDDKQNPQIKGVVPFIEFGSSDLLVVAKAAVDKKGKLVIRFCQNYTVANDFCVERLLDVTVKSGNFSEILKVSLKDITLNFTTQITGGNFSFDGTCTALKSVIDERAVTSQKPVDCSFSGDSIKTATGSEFSYKFRFKSKTQ